MRQSWVAVGLFLLTLTVTSSPVQQLEVELVSPISQTDASQELQYLERSLEARDKVDGIDSDALALGRRATYNCTDPAADWDQRCWDALDLTGWLDDPDTGWNHTVRICDVTENTESNTGADCCKPDEPWTTCFLRLGRGGPGSDCSEINAQSCVYQGVFSPRLKPEDRPKYQYVMKNIYAVNNFFTTYFVALGAAQADAQTIIQALVNRLNPVQPPKFNIFYLLSALSIGLAFLGAPSIAVAVLGLSFTAKVAAQTMIVALQQAPGTARALWPTGTTNSQNIQVGNLETELGNSTNQLAAMINSAVQLLMSDVPTFVRFCESGMWSGSTSLSLPSKVEGLDYALRTYMTSEAMGQNGWTAHPFIGPYLDLNDVENPYSGFSCQMGNNSVCTDQFGSAFYWSRATGHVYDLRPKDVQQKGIPTAYELTQDIVNNNWGILEVLFDGAFNCTLEGNAGNSVVNFNWDGTLNIACISQLPMVMPCTAPCPVALVNGTCPAHVQMNACIEQSKVYYVDS